MKLLALGAMVLALVPAAPSVSFESGSVRVGDEVISDTVMQLRDTSAGHILVSGNSVEPLARPLSIALSADRSLVLEPGVRVERSNGTYTLSIHSRRRIELEAEGEKIVLVAPVSFEVGEKGWKVAGKEYPVRMLAARRQQDDVDQNLNQLNNSAKRIMNTPSGTQQNPPGPNPPAPPKKPAPAPFAHHHRGLIPPISFNLFLGNTATDSNAISVMTHTSPIGF